MGEHRICCGNGRPVNNASDDGQQRTKFCQQFCPLDDSSKGRRKFESSRLAGMALLSYVIDSAARNH